MNFEPFRICIFGAGSIGCYLGGLLSHAGCNVVFIGRERFKKAVNENGLTLTHFDRDTVHIRSEQFTFTTDSEAMAKADIILVTVKSQDSLDAGNVIAACARRDALIISFQNGLGNVDALAQGLKGKTTPDHIILGGVVPFNVTGTGAGKFHCGTEGRLSVQDLPPDIKLPSEVRTRDTTVQNNPAQNTAVKNSASTRLRELSDAFALARLGMDIVPDIRAVQWGKLLVNLNNALNALYGGTLKTGLMQRDYRHVLAAMIEEAHTVLVNAGENIEKFGPVQTKTTLKILRLPNWIYGLVMDRVIKIDENARSSMLDDLEIGRKSEIDYLQGEIIRVAKRTGQTAPINAAIMAATLAAFDAGQSPRMSGADMKDFLSKQGIFK